MDYELRFEKSKLPDTIGRAGFCRLKVPESFQKHLAYIGALRRTFRLLRRGKPVGRRHPCSILRRLLVDFVE